LPSPDLTGAEEKLMGIGLGGAAGEAIAGGAGKWRLIAVGVDGCGKDAACGCCQGNDLRRCRRLCGVLFGQGEDEEVDLLGGLRVADER
jgi:hypothetical protein